MICILRIWRLRGKAVISKDMRMVAIGAMPTKSYLEDQSNESAVCEVMGKSIVVEAPSNDNDL